MLEGKVALITGAAKGIGRAIALAMAAEKATVVINYNGSKERAEQVLEEVKALGADGCVYQCNVADTADTDAMIKEIIKTYGHLDILVNNAGITRDNLIMKMSEEDFDAVYTYQRTCFSHTKPGEFTTKNSLRQMQPYSAPARKWSRIGMLAARVLYFSKPFNDPEVRMMSEGILEGNIDSVCNQSGGMIKQSTIQRIVDSANRRAKNEG